VEVVWLDEVDLRLQVTLVVLVHGDVAALCWLLKDHLPLADVALLIKIEQAHRFHDPEHRDAAFLHENDAQWHLASLDDGGAEVEHLAVQTRHDSSADRCIRREADVFVDYKVLNQAQVAFQTDLRQVLL